MQDAIRGTSGGTLQDDALTKWGIGGKVDVHICLHVLFKLLWYDRNDQIYNHQVECQLTVQFDDLMTRVQSVCVFRRTISRSVPRSVLFF